MGSKHHESKYTELEEEIDIQEFKESIIGYFSSIPDLEILTRPPID